MMSLVRIVAFLHTAVYLGIILYGWQSYKRLRTRSWFYMGMGFFILLAYRLERFIGLLPAEYGEMNEMNIVGTIIPFTGGLLLLLAFWKLSKEHEQLIEALAQPNPPRSGSQSVEYWLGNIRTIVREEIQTALER